MTAPKFLNRKIWPRLSFKQDVVVLSSIVLFIYTLLSIGGFIEYKYFVAGKARAECNRLFEEKDFESSAKECSKSASYWFRQNVKDKAEKSFRLYSSHLKYTAGLEAYQDTKWEEAMKLLSKVLHDDPDYANAVEKIASAKKKFALLEMSGKVAKSIDNKDEEQKSFTSPSHVVNTLSSSRKKPNLPHRNYDRSNATTKNNISSLEKKVDDLERR